LLIDFVMHKRGFWVGLFLTLQIILAFCWWTPPAEALTENQQLVMQSWRIVNNAYVDGSFNHQNWWLIREKTMMANCQ